MTESVIIFGGSGFLGGELASRFKNYGVGSVCIADPVRSVISGVEWIPVDILDIRAVRRAMGGGPWR